MGRLSEHIFIIFNGVRSSASPVESLNSHKTTKARRCRIFDTFCFCSRWRKLVCRHKDMKTDADCPAIFLLLLFCKGPCGEQKGKTSDSEVNPSTSAIACAQAQRQGAKNRLSGQKPKICRESPAPCSLPPATYPAPAYWSKLVDKIGAID